MQIDEGQICSLLELGRPPFSCPLVSCCWLSGTGAQIGTCTMSSPGSQVCGLKPQHQFPWASTLQLAGHGTPQSPSSIPSPHNKSLSAYLPKRDSASQEKLVDMYMELPWAGAVLCLHHLNQEMTQASHLASLFEAAIVQSYGFSSSRVRMRELDHKEGWTPKNWCFRTVVLEEILKSPLDCKETQPAHPKGNQPWIVIGRTDAEAEAPILWPPDVKNWLIRKDPDAGKDWGQEKEATEDEMAG